jgi:hypothetical protein
MKRTAIFIIALVMALALCSCGGGEASSATQPAATEPPAEAVAGLEDFAGYWIFEQEGGGTFVSVIEGNDWVEYGLDGLQLVGSVTDNGDGTLSMTEVDLGEYGILTLSDDGNTMTMTTLADNADYEYVKTDEAAVADIVGAEGENDVSAEAGESLTLTLYADMSAGSTAEGLISTKEIELPLEDEPASTAVLAMMLADELSAWTGLDFTLNDVTIDGDDAIVDWSADSTLIAGLGDREQKPEFHMFDAISENWFMMDSLATTLKNNLAITTVYYSCDGGPVTFINPVDMAAEGLPELPVDQPYEGSVFFVSHADAQ